MLHVGQLVTWPKVRFIFKCEAMTSCNNAIFQLHMIENRFRLEKQILLGRQAVRRALQSRGQERTGHRLEVLPQEGLPSPITGTNIPFISPDPQFPDTSLPVDTDAETTYFEGPHVSPSRHGLSSRELRRAARRRWKSNHRSEHGEGPQLDSSESRGATPDPPPPDTETDVEDSRLLSKHATPESTNSVGFFTRLRTTSIPASFSPFTTLRRNRLISPDGQHDSVDQSWSGDSSSEDDLSITSRRRHLYPSLFEDRMSEDEHGAQVANS